jgi:3-hydroxybutyryl-CoA dehydratase
MVAGLCTSILTSELVGTIGVSVEDRFWFTGPVFYGDTITFDVWIAEQHDETRTIVWEASARNEDGLEVLKARASLKFPRRKPS